MGQRPAARPEEEHRLGACSQFRLAIWLRAIKTRHKFKQNTKQWVQTQSKVGIQTSTKNLRRAPGLAKNDSRFYALTLLSQIILSYTKGRTDNYFANFVGETGGGVETAYHAQNVIHKYYVEHKE
jgi:hypothetical protein